MPTLKIPTPLKPYAGNQGSFKLPGENVGEVLNAVVDEHPMLKKHLFADDGSLRPFVNLFLGEENINRLDGLNTALSEEDTVLIIPSIAGG